MKSQICEGRLEPEPKDGEFERNKKEAQKEVGTTQWLSLKSRPDISTITSIAASRIAHNPKEALRLRSGIWKYLAAHLEVFGSLLCLFIRFATCKNKLLVLHCVLLFVVLTAAVSSFFLQSVETTDRLKGDGWQTQEEREVGWQVKCGWKSSLPRLSPSMVARSGTAASAQSQNVWTRSNVEGVRQTFRQ